MRRLGALASLVAWLAFLGIAIRVLHGVSVPPEFSHSGDGSALVIGALRVAALALGWYLAATTALSFFAEVARVSAAMRVAERLTASPVHRLAKAAAGAVVAASTLVPSMAAAQQISPPVMTWVDQEQPVSTTADETPVVTTPSVPVNGDREVEVMPGDHLWSLSAKRMAEQLGRDPSDREVSPYWVRVVRSNVAGGYLRNAGAPDLLYPGDRVILPSP